MALMGPECCQGALSMEEKPLYGQIPQIHLLLATPFIFSNLYLYFHL